MGNPVGYGDGDGFGNGDGNGFGTIRRNKRRRHNYYHITQETTMKTVCIDGVEYVEKAKVPSGNRAVIVVDRGWIYAGDVTEENGRIKLSRAVWVFKWSSIGFDGVLKHPEKADIRKLDHMIDIPKDAEIYRVPVDDNWAW